MPWARRVATLSRPCLMGRRSTVDRVGSAAGRTVDIGQRGRVEARVAGQDAGGRQLPVVGPLPFGTVEALGVAPGSVLPDGRTTRASASARRTSSATWWNWLATPSPIRRPGAPVDQDEEGRAGNLVVAPGLGGHHHGQPGGAWAATSAGISMSGSLGDHHQPGAGGKTQVVGLPEVLQKPAQVAHPDERKASRVS